MTFAEWLASYPDEPLTKGGILALMAAALMIGLLLRR